MDWFNNEGNSESFKTITSGQGASGGGTNEWKLLCNIDKECQHADGGKPLYFTSKCTGTFLRLIFWQNCHNTVIFAFSVTYVKKDNPAYRGCPGKEGAETKCNKKLVDEGNGNFRCEKCQLETTKFNWRLVLKAQVMHSKNSTCHWNLHQLRDDKNAEKAS